MSKPSQARQEAEVLEYNAKEGARAVTFLWLFRKLIVPLAAIFMVIVISAFIRNGPVAGLMSALVFGFPLLLLFAFSSSQLRKILGY
ncbi:hypothetical protein [Ruegeria hyattellae]|uniref:hypothetical protein n=1 Tax=Ruegeria hyattellae TaxID=3233337 RepID=UPI00355C3EE4